MKRRSLWVGITLLVALLLTGCSEGGKPAASSKTPSTAPGGAPISASSTSPTLTVTLTMPSTSLKAASIATATISLKNSSDATAQVGDFARLVILDSSGSTVFESSPSLERVHHVILGVPLGPGSTLIKQRRFTVPPPGHYAAQARFASDSGTATLSFESVR